MASLELGQLGSAGIRLYKTSVLQPDRHEPHVALSRLFVADSSLGLAAYHLREAIRLGATGPELDHLRQRVEGMIRTEAPADLAASSVLTFQDDPYTLYLWREGDTYILYRVGPDRVEGLPLGTYSFLTMPPRITKEPLPGSSTGYWLSGRPVGAYVSGSSAYYLFSADGDRFRQIIFEGSNQLWATPTVLDYMRSMRSPKIKGNQVESTFGDDASGNTTIVLTYELSLAGETARLVSLRQVDMDPRK